MEVGAVLQAFNNELIHMKKKLNQAKIQIIHNLTRKAKTLIQKKPPEHLKEKIERKAKAAVNEVLILKKLQVKEVAKFAITHTGQLKDYLNKPDINKEKACARLLLHKCLEDKYDFLRTTYSKLPAEDLLRSRDERKKIKKEQREKQKNKQKEKLERKNKKKTAGTEGDWIVEDVDANRENNKKASKKLKLDNEDSDAVTGSDNEDSKTDNISDNNDSEVDNEDTANNANSSDEDGNDLQKEDDHKVSDDESEHVIADNNDNPTSEAEESDKETKSDDFFVTPSTNRVAALQKSTKEVNRKKISVNKKPPKEDNRKKIPKNKDGNKKKNLTEKMQSRKFKKDNDDTTTAEGNKIVDPFFITASGDNYMTLAEPRAPDEVKEEHRQGNRNMRRAAKFGYEPKYKPRQNYENIRSGRQNIKFGQQNSKSGQQNNKFGQQNNKFGQQHNTCGKQNGLQNNNSFNPQSYSSDTGNKRPREDNFSSNFSKKPRDNSFKSKTAESFEKPAVPEKLHPSWEAKKKQSGLLPFQGKKIVFS